MIVLLEDLLHVGMPRRLRQVVVHARVKGTLADVFIRVRTHAANLRPNERSLICPSFLLLVYFEQFLNHLFTVHDRHLIVEEDDLQLHSLRVTALHFKSLFKHLDTFHARYGGVALVAKLAEKQLCGYQVEIIVVNY